MLRKRSKSISLLVALAFMFTMILPSMAFGAGMCEFGYSPIKGLDAGAKTGQELAFIRIDDMEPAQAVYVDIILPDDVEWEGPVEDIGIDYFISISDDTLPLTLVSGSKDNKYSVCFDTSTIYDNEADEWDDLFIEVNFRDTGTKADSYESAVLIGSGAEDDIIVKAFAKGIVGNNPRWDEEEDCLVGITGDKEVTVTAKTPKSISIGDEQQIAKITFTENVKNALAINDEFVLTLPSDIEWDWSKMKAKAEATADEFYISGSYGLKAKVTLNDDNKDELLLKIENFSKLFEDELEFQGYVVVYPGANDGDVEVDIDSNLDECDFDDTSIVVAYVGDTDLTVEIDDDSDDAIYPGVFGKKLDSFTMEASSDFVTGDAFTMTLSEGVVWYMDEGDFASKTEDLKVLGLYDDNQSVWLEILDGAKDELDFDNLVVATLPDCPVGDITVTIEEDFTGEFVIGEVLAGVEVSADAPLVSLGTMASPAGDIVLKETAKDVWTDDYYGDVEVKPFLKLSLPSGVGFSDEPTVLVNGDDVDPDFYYDYVDADDKERFSDGDEDIYIVFSEKDFSDSKIDTMEITDIAYDLDSRVKGSEVEVEMGGTLLNFLTGAGGDEEPYKIEDFEEDYADDSALTVVNAVTKAVGSAESVFTIGSTTYTVDGEEFTMDVAPYIAGDRTYLPVRFVAYALGITDNNILWDQAAQTVTLMKGDKVVQLQVGSTTMMINGAAVTMDVAPQNTSDRVCLPVRFVAQAFGAEVGWDAATQQVTIDL